MYKLRLLVSVVLFLSLIFFAKYTFAQEVDLKLSPPSVELLMKPGVKVRVPFTVTNKADKLSLKPVVKSFVISNDEKSVTYTNLKENEPQAVILDNNFRQISGFSLDKGQSKKIYVNISSTQEVVEKDYNFVLILETQPDFIDKQYSARIKAQIAAPILTTVTQTGKTEVRGSIDVFEIVGKKIPFLFGNVAVFDSFDPIPIQLEVKNEGKNVVFATGEVVVRGSLGEKASYQLSGRNILAQSIRHMKSSKSEGDITAVIRGFFIGKYYVNTTVNLAEGSVQLSKSTQFYAYPFKIVIIAILCAITGLTVLRRKK